MRFPLRRVLLGFAVGASAGWVASLLRKPADPPEESSAAGATRLPQEEFGSPVGEEQAAEETPEVAAEETPAPKKATAPAVKRPPGTRKTQTADPEPGASEPATAPEAGAEQVAPRRRRTTPDPAKAAADALREGHAAATERLSGAEADATPPPDDQSPARKRRRRPAE